MEQFELRPLRFGKPLEPAAAVDTLGDLPRSFYNAFRNRHAATWKASAMIF